MIYSIALYWAISTVLCLGFVAKKNKKITLADLILSIFFGMGAWITWVLGCIRTERFGQIIWDTTESRMVNQNEPNI